MMFQLVLSDKLREHLSNMATDKGAQLEVADASMDRMAKTPGYA